MKDHFKLTPQAKEAVLRGSMGDITNGIPFDYSKVQVIYDFEADRYVIHWSLWSGGVKVSEFTSEQFCRANVCLDTEALSGRIDFKLL